MLSRGEELWKGPGEPSLTELLPNLWDGARVPSSLPTAEIRAREASPGPGHCSQVKKLHLQAWNSMEVTCFSLRVGLGPWASYWTFLSLKALICRVECHQRALWELIKLMQHSALCLALMSSLSYVILTTFLVYS